jgi:hypothetical protein
MIKILPLCILAVSTLGLLAAEEGHEEYRSPGFQKSALEGSIGFAIKALYDRTLDQLPGQLEKPDQVFATSGCEHTARWFIHLERYQHGLVGLLAYPEQNGVGLKILPTPQVSSEELETLSKEFSSLRQKADKGTDPSPQSINPCEIRVSIQMGGNPSSFVVKIPVDSDPCPAISDLIEKLKNSR